MSSLVVHRASPGYEIFAGSAETLGGILLIIPRTTMLGALICMNDMIQIFMLNMTYDVAVKRFSFHLLLIALFLLAPEFQRMANFFFLNRAVDPSTQPQLFATRHANRIALTAQLLFLIWLLGIQTYGGWTSWHAYGGGRAKSPLYGIWNIDQISIDGQIRSPLLTDYGRWRRAIFDFPTRVSFQRMDDSLAGYGVSINSALRTLDIQRTTIRAGDRTSPLTVRPRIG